MKASLLFLLSSTVLPASLLACEVTLNGEVKTEEFFVIDSTTNEAYVDCIGKSKCRDVVIVDCPVVKCFDNEACNSAQILNFTESVLCEGLHSCHRTEMTAATTEGKKTISCLGSGACDVAQISGEIEQVSCSGVKACRKVHIEGAKLVKCHDGHENTPACESFATFIEPDCLYCGKNGCSEHINMCRYKPKGDVDVDDGDLKHKYKKCAPESLIGECSAELEAELKLELSGRSKIETNLKDGTRKIRRRLR